MAVDAVGDPVTMYRFKTEAARAYSDQTITWAEYWDHIGRSYDLVDSDTPSPTSTDGGFYYPDNWDEETLTPPSMFAETPQPASTPTPTPTPGDDEGDVPGLP